MVLMLRIIPAIFLFSFILLPIMVRAQSDANIVQEGKSNAVFLELGGNGLMISGNYERRLLRKIDFRGRIGVGAYGTHFTIPIGIDYNLKLSHHSFIDFGFGITYTKAVADFYVITERNRNGPAETKDFYLIPIPGAQYKYISNSGFLLKAGVFLPIRDFGPIPYIGVSIGHSF